MKTTGQAQGPAPTFKYTCPHDAIIWRGSSASKAFSTLFAGIAVVHATGIPVAYSCKLNGSH